MTLETSEIGAARRTRRLRGMSGDQRLNRLRALADRLERLPTSAQHEWILSEVRARAVDIETGEPPRPMRALDPDAAVSTFQPPGRVPTPEPVDLAAVASREPQPLTRAEAGAALRARTAAPRPVSTGPVLVKPVAHPRAPQPAPLGGERSAIAGRHGRCGLLDDEILCLGDLPTSASTTPGSLPGDDQARPWVRGLRG